MCRYCNYYSDDCSIFIDPIDGNYYWNINEKNEHVNPNINYCPMCGRQLKRKCPRPGQECNEIICGGNRNGKCNS